MKKKKSKGWIIPLLLFGGITAAVLTLPKPTEAASPDAVTVNESVVFAKAKGATIVTKLSGAGVLSASETEASTYPEVIEIDCYHVQNGDRVKAGDILASIDKISVDKAIAELKEVIETLNSDLDYNAAGTNKESIAAPTSGRVKEIYACQGQYAEGENLVLLNLDGLMQVNIKVPDYITSGNAVEVTDENGNVEKATVRLVIDGIATITFSDERVKNGAVVKISDRDGNTLGKGTATVHCPWIAKGYYGIVSSVPLYNNQQVYEGTPLVYLRETGNTDKYRALYARRLQLDEQLAELMALSRDGYIRAEYAGVVSGIPDDAEITLLSSAQSRGSISLLTAPEAPYKITLLAATPASYTGNVWKITAINGNMVTLRASVDQVTIPDYSYAVALANVMTMSGDAQQDFTNVTVLATDGVTQIPVAGLAVGDVLFFDSTNGLIKAGNAGSGGGTQPSGGGGQGGGGMPSGGGSGSGKTSGSSGGKTGGTAPTGGTSGQDTEETSYESYSLERTELLTIVGTENMTIEVLIDELDILNVSMGMKTVVTLDAMKGESFEGVVTAIGQNGTNSGGNTKYAVEVTILKGENMLEGMNASVIMETSSDIVPVSIDISAISQENGKTVVYTGYDKKTDTLMNPVEVKTGVSDGETVEIISGLNDGDEYYYKYADSVTYGFLSNL